ncbi:inositol monophosphatase family protein [Leptolyngbya sp. 7M]|uniref:inositol monophosphatase family protein n=1 Tax=Leptolyngbya sp. 7M TaxID=2812896 RepID=UPI0029391BFB|nr:inositol monophosphatase family protein [Leptolyngbya sp. 7M]
MLCRTILAAAALMVLCAATISFAQAPIFVENFNIAEGALLTENGWTAHSAGGTNPIIGVVPGLTYSGYPGSGVGNAAGMTTSGEDVHRTFTVQSSGSVYAAFMVRVSDASTDAGGGYFFHLSPDPIGTAFRARVFAKRDASNNLSFGISKAVTTAADIAFTPFTYSLNTTYLIVVKYTIVDGTANDTVAMYINPTLPGNEPGAPTVSATDTSQSDIAVGSVALRQGTAATHPTVVIDGIRIGTSWASITTATINQAKYVDFNGDGRTDYAVVRNIPFLQELFRAAQGLGATRNRQPIRVSQTAALAQSLLVTGFAYDRRETPDNNYAEFCHLTHLTQGVRRGGAASVDLAYVACGRLDGYWERGLSAWDMAAGVVIVEEAGGRVTAYDQGEFEIGSGRILATNGLIHSALSRELLRVKPLPDDSLPGHLG